MSDPTSRERVAALLRPRTLALVGASDRSTFSRLISANLAAAGLGEVTALVNPRSESVHGRTTFASCRDAAESMGRPVDVAFVMVPQAAVPAALQDAAAAGASGVLVLSSGYAEAGADGRQAQHDLLSRCQELDLTLLGPNVLGYVNVAAGIPAIALANPPVEAGPVALISQSGASCAAMKDFAALADIGLSHVITVGNEAMITVGHLIDHLVDEPDTRAIAVFMEAIRDPAVFAAAARRAEAAGKAVVVLKAGRSDLAARAAASHTGALVGDDRVIGAVLDRLGVIRVDTIEDMLVTASVAAHTGPLRAPSAGVISISGGACDIVADLAEGRLDLPELGEHTIAELDAVLPGYAHAQNPLDVTGAALAEPEIWRRSVAAVGNDPAIGATLVINSLPLGDSDEPFYGQAFVTAIGRGMAESAAPALYLTQVTQPVGLAARRALQTGGVARVVPGLRLGVDALTKIAAWSRTAELRAHDASGFGPMADAGSGAEPPDRSSTARQPDSRTAGQPDSRASGRPDSSTSGRADSSAARADSSPAGAESSPARAEPSPAGADNRPRSGPDSEVSARELLIAGGVPVVPARHVHTPDEAYQAAVELDAGLGVAIKLVSPDVAHKSDIGGVRLGVGADEAREAYRAVVAAAAGVPGASADGALVSPMRSPATELMVGLTRDPQWGLMLAVAVGGVLVEVLDDAAITPLPVSPARARHLLTGLRASRLLTGVRGQPGADLDALATVICAVAQLAADLGPALQSLEINPLRVHESQIEALDALIVWSADTAPGDDRTTAATPRRAPPAGLRPPPEAPSNRSPVATDLPAASGHPIETKG
ncbi:MAG: acetate--CoA ligase family protein [Actinomycetales bacterium]